MKFISILGGTIILIITGAIIGFWIEELYLSNKLPNDFYECKDCGSSWKDLELWVRNKHGRRI